MLRLPLWILAIVTLLPVDALTPVLAQEAGGQPTRTIQVFAAASTTDAILEIKRQFTKHSGVEVLASFGSSGALAQQIAHGADADVFLSADAKWIDHLTGEGLVVRRQNLMSNRLVIVVPGDSRITVTKPGDLLATDIQHLALGNPESVPAGSHARLALIRLGLWEKLRPKVAAAEDVRGALNYVETGAAEAGIVYATDAAISKRVKVVATIAESLTGPIRYPVVLLEHGQDDPAAESFYRFLCSPAACIVFEKRGFTTLTETATTNKPSGRSP